SREAQWQAWSVRRRECFVEAADELGGVEVASWRLNPWGSDGLEVATQILTQDPRPTAVFAVTDHEALFLYEAAAALGLKIPQDVSIVGFADLDFAATLRPPLTTMRQRPREIGRRAAQQILDRLDGDAADDPPSVIKVGADLILRKSTAPPSS
ncbi:MAG TPA: substrate-binding domain-containing protein, partial [Lacipirellula sp.]